MPKISISSLAFDILLSSLWILIESNNLYLLWYKIFLFSHGRFYNPRFIRFVSRRFLHFVIFLLSKLKPTERINPHPKKLRRGTFVLFVNYILDVKNLPILYFHFPYIFILRSSIPVKLTLFFKRDLYHLRVGLSQLTPPSRKNSTS